MILQRDNHFKVDQDLLKILKRMKKEDAEILAYVINYYTTTGMVGSRREPNNFLSKPSSQSVKIESTAIINFLHHVVNITTGPLRPPDTRER